MKIKDDITNSTIEYCINEYVRLIEHRDILREKWFNGFTFEQLAAKYDKSVTAIKKIVYETGDKVLLKADEIKLKTDKEQPC